MRGGGGAGGLAGGGGGGGGWGWGGGGVAGSQSTSIVSRAGNTSAEGNCYDRQLLKNLWSTVGPSGPLSDPVVRCRTQWSAVRPSGPLSYPVVRCCTHWSAVGASGPSWSTRRPAVPSTTALPLSCHVPTTHLFVFGFLSPSSSSFALN